MSNTMSIIKDCNEKEIKVDLTKIADINGDLGEGRQTISDYQTVSINKQDVSFFDSNGTELNPLNIIKDIKSNDGDIVAIDVYCEGTHSGINHNHFSYDSASMENDAGSFLMPYQKPLLKNHNSYSEPMGRVKETSFGPSVMTDERDAINLVIRVSDRDAMEKFVDKRYSTFSIGGKVKDITCQICGKRILKDGIFKFCGHWRGEVYNNRVCYWTAKDITYDEISVVNNPADDFAQVTKIVVVRDENKTSSAAKDQQGKDDNMFKPEGEVADLMDSELDKAKQDGVSDANASEDVSAIVDSALKSNEEKPENTAASIKDATEGGETSPSIEEQLTTANDRIAQLESELSVKDELITTLTQEKETAIADSNSYRAKVVKLATLNKQMIVDGIVKEEMALKKITEEAKDERETELLSKTLGELNTISDSLSKEKPAQREVRTITNPGLANTTEDELKDNKNNTKEIEKKETKKSINDFANDVINRLYK